MKIDKQHLAYARLKNQHLIEKAPSAQVLSDLCGVQAQFPNNPKHAIKIRSNDYDEENWGQGLAKIWSFRHTLHMVRLDEAGLFLGSRGSPGNWEGWGMPKERMEELAELLLALLREGIDEREALKAAFRERGATEEEIGSAFHGWGGLFYECNRRGFTGSLPGTAKRYFIMNAELVETEAARREIMKRYFTHYGPASIDDFLAFTGHKKTEVKELLKEKVLEMTEVECEGKKLYVQGEMPENGKIPKCLFLAGFDQMIMGYKDRTSILRDEWKRSLITVSGIVLPPLMLDGNIVGRWKKDKKVMEVLLFGKIGKAKVQLIERSVSKEFPDVEKCLVHEQI